MDMMEIWVHSIPSREWLSNVGNWRPYHLHFSRWGMGGYSLHHSYSVSGLYWPWRTLLNIIYLIYHYQQTTTPLCSDLHYPWLRLKQNIPQWSYSKRSQTYQLGYLTTPLSYMSSQLGSLHFPFQMNYTQYNITIT